ncbi:MAG: AzlD domain-containing protein, partial [Spirochaetia bacterium]|nr:AzlD domain-containing protein [Spirochaetia bacterium]
MYTFFAIITSGIVSTLIRVLPVSLIQKPIQNKFLKSFLYYVPFVTLSVMTFPSILHATDSVFTGIMAFILGIILSFMNMGLFIVAVCLCAFVLIFEFF